MNVYDEAHSLARAIKESNEFKEFDRLRLLVDQDNDVTAMLKELTELQMAVQTAQMAGQEPDPDMIKRIQSLGAMAGTKPLAAQYLAAQGAFSVMMNDVFAIVAEAMQVK